MTFISDPDAGQKRVLEKITELKNDSLVLDQSVSWYPKRWEVSGLERYHGSVEKFSNNCPRDGENYRISRRNVIEVSKNIDDVFVGSMIIGYGDRGFGPSRVKKILKYNSQIFDRNLHAQYEASKNGPEESWVSHTKTAKLMFLGPSFATKLAYFSARHQKAASPIPLIADINTSWGSWELAKIPRSVEQLDGYLRYVKLAHDWGASHGEFGADEVERALFAMRKKYVPKKFARTA